MVHLASSIGLLTTSTVIFDISDTLKYCAHRCARILGRMPRDFKLTVKRSSHKSSYDYHTTTSRGRDLPDQSPTDQRVLNAISYREKQRAQSIGPDLSLIHTQGCELLPNRLLLLERFPKGGVYAEVGVATGTFSKAIFEHCAPKELHLIDLWEGDRYEPGLRLVQQRLADEIQSGRVVISRGYSTAVLEGYPDSFFDVIYIDTNHSYELTLRELEIASKKVKPDGIISGHDFCVGNVVAPYVYGVIQACCRFVQEAGWTFKYLTLEPHGHWSFALIRL